MTPEEVETEWLIWFDGEAHCLGAIKDFKSALRREIEKHVHLLQTIQLKNDLSSHGSGSLNAFQVCLELIDSLTPPKL